MSTDWGIGCRTCRDAGLELRVYRTEIWNNCRDLEGLRRLIRAQKEIVAVAAVLGDQVHFYWSRDWSSDSTKAWVADFMTAHLGHVLEPMNEYGRFDEQCYKTVIVPACGHAHACILNMDHEGPCSPTQRKE